MARIVEIHYAKKMSIWTTNTRNEPRRRGWKIANTRWLDINKGDVETPIERSWMVGNEFTT